MMRSVMNQPTATINTVEAAVNTLLLTMLTWISGRAFLIVRAFLSAFVQQILLQYSWMRLSLLPTHWTMTTELGGGLFSVSRASNSCCVRMRGSLP